MVANPLFQVVEDTQGPQVVRERKEEMVGTVVRELKEPRVMRDPLEEGDVLEYQVHISEIFFKKILPFFSSNRKVL